MESEVWECLACGGSGQSSKGTECYPCGGTGSVELVMALAQHSCESIEHYTPSHIVELARELMGSIDLDPASCALVQETMRAEAWYGPGSPLGEDGLIEPWLGHVFLNPPGGKVDGEGRAIFLGCGKRDAPNAGACGIEAPHRHEGVLSSAAFWWGMLAHKWETDEIDQALFVGFSLEFLRSAQQLPVHQPLTFPFVVPLQRIAFDALDEQGQRVSSKSPTHANVLVWLPPKTQWSFERFQTLFGSLGQCVNP